MDGEIIHDTHGVWLECSIVAYYAKLNGNKIRACVTKIRYDNLKNPSIVQNHVYSGHSLLRDSKQQSHLRTS